MEGFCDFCGEKRELVFEGLAKICWICKSNQFKKFKEVKAKLEDFESKKLTLNSYGEYLRNQKKKILFNI